jgi:excinuclease ABC subunit C
VIDGGPGQLAAARAVLAEQGRGELPVIGLAKERVERDATATEVRPRPERIFLPGRKNPLVLRANSSALFLLQRLRDEAHRFANEYHRRLRARRGLASPLDEVLGVGRRQAAARCCARSAAPTACGARPSSSWKRLPGVTRALAERIKERFERDD